jgi:hypothetical protein
VIADVELERSRYVPGELLRAKVRLDPEAAGRRVELSVLWETSGKGDTDVGVIFHRVLAGEDAAAEHHVEVRLPALPLTYTGDIVKIAWAVRVRRLAMIGDDDVLDAPFVLAWPDGS